MVAPMASQIVILSGKNEKNIEHRNRHNFSISTQPSLICSNTAHFVNFILEVCFQCTIYNLYYTCFSFSLPWYSQA